MKINKYPDGSSYVSDASEADDAITFKVNSYEDLWHLSQFIDAYHSYVLKWTPTITIPNLIDAQADRRFHPGESSGLKLVCQFLNGLDANFKIFHPHNAEVVEALMDNVEIVDNHEFITEVISRIGWREEIVNHTRKDLLSVLMSSDAGGFKPLMKLCDQLRWGGETFSASKARTKDGMKQLVDREDFQGKDILIIDDICVYGGTFKGLSKLLRERNCGKLYLAVSHMTVQNLGEDPVTNYFDKVFTTNSKFDEYNSNFTHIRNLEVINLF